MKDKKHRVLLFLVITLLCLMPFAYHAVATKQPKEATTTIDAEKQPEKGRSKEVISEENIERSPDGKHFVVFAGSVQSGVDPEHYYATRLEFHHTSKGLIKVVDVTGTTIAYEYYGTPEENWSPDGRYFVVNMIGPVPSGSERSRLTFIDVCTGEEMRFKSNKEIVDTSNFVGWKEGEPHTALAMGKAPKFKNYSENYPNNNPDPKQCE